MHFCRIKITTNLVRKELGRRLRRAYDLRQKGDYAMGFMVGGSEAKKILEF